MAEIMENVEETLDTQQENLENIVTDLQDGGFDIKPIAIGVAAGTATIALAKPASKLAIKGAKWVWSKTGAKIFNKSKGTKPEEAPKEEAEADPENEPSEETEPNESKD